MPDAYVKQTWIDGTAGGTPISAARLAYIEDGIENATVEDGTYVQVVDVTNPAYGAVLDGTTNNSAAIALAETAAAGKVLYFPPGVAGIGGAGISPKTSNVTWRGAGMWQSTIKSLAGSTAFIASTGSDGADNLTFEDLCFDGSDLITTMINITGARQRKILFRRCRFTGIGSGTAASVAAAFGVRFLDCIFQAPGTGAGRGILFQTGGGSHQVTGCKFLWLKDGIIVDNGAGSSVEEARLDFLTVSHNEFEGGWWLLKTVFSGEGASVSYAITTGTIVELTDTAAAFAGITTAAGSETNIRIMPVRLSGNSAASSSSLVTSGLIAAGVRRGDIIRQGTSFSVVTGVQSDTVVRLEGWYDNTTYESVAPPASGPWTIYGVWLGRVGAFTATTLTMGRIHDMDGVTVVPPTIAAGTRYEVMPKRGNYMFQTEKGSHGLKVHHNIFRRGWSDQIGLQGSQHCSIIDNDFIDGQDMGVTLDTDSRGCTVAHNRARHQGAGGFYIRGSDHIVTGNSSEDAVWQNPTSELGDFQLADATNCTVTDNRAKRTNAAQPYSLYGFMMRGGGSGNKLRGNRASGHAGAGYRFVVGAPTGTKMRDNEGTLSLVAGTPAIDFGVSVTITVQTGTTYTLVLEDQGTELELTNAAAVTVTIPPNSTVPYAIGTVVNIRQMGAGTVTVAAGAGVTLRAPSGARTSKQYATVSIVKRATDEWVLSGDAKV